MGDVGALRGRCGRRRRVVTRSTSGTPCCGIAGHRWSPVRSGQAAGRPRRSGWRRVGGHEHDALSGTPIRLISLAVPQLALAGAIAPVTALDRRRHQHSADRRRGRSGVNRWTPDILRARSRRPCRSSSALWPGRPRVDRRARRVPERPSEPRLAGRDRVSARVRRRDPGWNGRGGRRRGDRRDLPGTSVDVAALFTKAMRRPLRANASVEGEMSHRLSDVPIRG